MALSDEARGRLADIVELQPTKNAELQDRWGMDSGSDVHQYLENELGDYYYRDDNSLIRATDEALSLVDVKPGVEENGDDGELLVRVPKLERRILEALPGPTDRSISVVATLERLREAHDIDPDVEEVRSALQTLRRKGVVDVEHRIVPTYRLATDRASIVAEPPASEA